MTNRFESFNVLLKTSFFRNDLYNVSCDTEKIFFKCLRHRSEDFAISLKDVDTLYIYGSPLREIEIRMRNKVIIGNFKSARAYRKAASILKEVFKERCFHID